MIKATRHRENCKAMGAPDNGMEKTQESFFGETAIWR
jgi:hypothetical protein